MADSSLRPALAGSAALHLLVLGAGLIAFPQSAMKLNPAVPVTIVSRAPTPDLRPAVEAPTPETAASPEPETAAEPPAPEPAPTPPTPQKPTPAPPPPPPPLAKAPAPKPPTPAL